MGYKIRRNGRLASQILRIEVLLGKDVNQNGYIGEKRNYDYDRLEITR